MWMFRSGAQKSVQSVKSVVDIVQFAPWCTHPGNGSSKAGKERAWGGASHGPDGHRPTLQAAHGRDAVMLGQRPSPYQPSPSGWVECGDGFGGPKARSIAVVTARDLTEWNGLLPPVHSSHKGPSPMGWAGMERAVGAFPEAVGQDEVPLGRAGGMESGKQEGREPGMVRARKAEIVDPWEIWVVRTERKR